ncbi:MAG: carbamate kinase [Desulfurococcales archaeon]|nr:carbamate kinase [Desulfurococcales archaeon]
MQQDKANGRELIVVALGGNAIQRKGERGHPSEQWRNARSAAKALVEVVEKGYKLVITHGNGPQVGYLMEAFDSLGHAKPRQTLDIAVAMTQGWLGFIISHAIQAELMRRGLRKEVVTLVTRVLVDPRDPGFAEPSKPIGGYYTREEAEKLARTHGWVMKPDPRGGYRRVVPSPRPVDIMEAPIIRKLVNDGVIVVAAGGGGIPISLEGYVPIEAVIDKDLASALLAVKIGADRLVILTDVPGVAINFRRPDEKWLHRVTAAKLKSLYKQGHFPPGSMGPKVLAAIEFVERTRGLAIIGSLDRALDVIEGHTGTIVEP